MNRFFSIYFTLSIILLSGCDKDKTKPSVVISPVELEIGAEAGTFDVGVTANVEVEVTPNVPWIVVAQATETVVSFEAQANTATTNRSGTVIFKQKGGNESKTLTVTQAGAQLTITSIVAAPVSMHYDETSELVVTFFPVTAPEPAYYTYESSDEYVAKVDENGVVSGVHVGECVITITTDKGIATECKVTIVPKSTLYTEPYLVFGGSMADVKAHEKRELVGEIENYYLYYHGENKYVIDVEYYFIDGELDECTVWLESDEYVDYCFDECTSFLFERYFYSHFDEEDGQSFWFTGKGIIAVTGFYLEYLYVWYFAVSPTLSTKTLDKEMCDTYKTLIRERKSQKIIHP